MHGDPLGTGSGIMPDGTGFRRPTHLGCTGAAAFTRATALALPPGVRSRPSFPAVAVSGPPAPEGT
jgi:hypothetical protein